MMNLNPFHEWWKREGYVSWTAYLIGMPIITIVIVIAWIVITIANTLYGLINFFKK